MSPEKIEENVPLEDEIGENFPLKLQEAIFIPRTNLHCTCINKIYGKQHFEVVDFFSIVWLLFFFGFFLGGGFFYCYMILEQVLKIKEYMFSLHLLS